MNILLLVYAVDGGQHGPGVDQRAAAQVVLGLGGRVYPEDGHHPRELAELRLVGLPGYPESHAARVPVAAAYALVVVRHRHLFRRVNRLLAAHVHVAGARPFLDPAQHRRSSIDIE